MRYTTALLAGTALPILTVGARVSSHGLHAKQASTVDVDLSDLSNTVNSLVTTLEGVLTAVLTPVANGQASISGDVTLPGTSDSLVHLQLDVTPEAIVVGKKKRQTASDCTLGVLLGGQNVLNVSLDSAGGQPQTYTTQDVPGSGTSLLSLVETCGDTPVDVDLANLVLIASPQSGSGSSSTSTSSGSSPTGSSDTGSSSTSSTGNGSGTDTGSSDSGSGSGGTGTGSNDTGSSSPGAGSGSSGNGTSSSGTGSDDGEGGSSGSGNTSGSSGSAAEVLPVSGSSSSATPTSSAMANPSDVNNYNFYACVGSAGHFPSFTLVGTNDEMTVEMCTSLCGAGYPFAGLHDTDCYCGTNIDGSTTARVSTGECNIPCPGDAAEVCGGTSTSATSFVRRQDTSDDILLTVFVNVLYLAAESGTVTVISSTTGIVTTSLTVAASTSSSLTATATSSSASASATCTTGACGSGWMFESYPGEECAGEVVFVVEECSCEGGWAYQPKECTATSCAGETVFKPTQCTDSKCEGYLVFETQSCGNCAGGLCYVQIANQSTGAANASSSASASAGSSASSGAGAAAAAAAAVEAGSGGASASAAAGAGSASAEAVAEAGAEAAGSSSASTSSGASSNAGNQTQSCGTEGCGEAATVLVAGSSRPLVDSLIVGILVFVAVF